MIRRLHWNISNRQWDDEVKQKKFIFWIEIQGKIWYTKHSMDFYVMNTQMQLHKNGMNILSIIIRFPELEFCSI